MQILNLGEVSDQLAQYQRNAGVAQSRLEQEETNLRLLTERAVLEVQQAIINLPAQSEADSALHLELNETGPMSLKLNIGSALALILQDDDPVVSLDVGGSASLSIDRSGAVTLESSGELNIKGSSNVQIEAGGQLNLKGTVINLN